MPGRMLAVAGCLMLISVPRAMAQEIWTGCLDPVTGSLSKVAAGRAPLAPCGPAEEAIQLSGPAAQSDELAGGSSGVRVSTPIYYARDGWIYSRQKIRIDRRTSSVNKRIARASEENLIKYGLAR